MITRKEAEDLLSKYEHGLCSDEELSWIETWYIHLNEDKALDLSSDNIFAAQARMMDSLNIPEKRTVVAWKKFAVAASIVLVSILGYYTLQRKQIVADITVAKVAKTIQPGGNNAVLILADGREINLEETVKGKLAEESGVTIVKRASGEIVYDLINSKQGTIAQSKVNTIVTPRGGTYQILLEDGSKVWLNAASSIKFPASFKVSERVVELQGEAYFEIAKISNRPFIVKTAGQAIQVLGTKFNVNSYADEKVLATTLLEGSVKVSNQLGSVILKPGQQSQSTIHEQIAFSEVKIAEYLAWKDGMFNFQRSDLQTVMRQFERWYNIDVRFEKDVPEIFFTGKIYRNLNLNDALSNLTFLGVKFKIEHRNVTVLAK